MDDFKIRVYTKRESFLGSAEADNTKCSISCKCLIWSQVVETRDVTLIWSPSVFASALVKPGELTKLEAERLRANNPLHRLSNNVVIISCSSLCYCFRLQCSACIQFFLGVN